MRKYIILFLLLIASPGFAAQEEITVVPDSPVLPSIGALKDALNLRLTAAESNFDELYAAVAAGALVIQTTAPADTTKVWIDTDQDNAIKVYITDTWTVVGSAGSDTLSALSCDSGEVAKWNGEAWACAADATAEAGSGDDLGGATYSDVVGLWTTCTGFLLSNGACVAAGTAASNLVQLNASAQLPAVSADLLTITDSGSYFTTDTVIAALQEVGSVMNVYPTSPPTADNQIIQATGGCSDPQYTSQAACETAEETWTPPVGVWTSTIDGLINDTGTGTDDLLSASEIDSRIAAGDNQTASEVAFTPNGSIAATSTQAAVQEVRDEAEARTPTTLSLTTDTSITTQQIADNKYLTNYGASGEVDIILPAISYNQTRTILIEAAQVLEISPPSGEVLELSGTDLTADYCINSGSAVGNKATITRLRVGASSWKWSVDVVRGTWASCGAASD